MERGELTNHGNLNGYTRSGMVGLAVEEPVCLLNRHVLCASGKHAVSGELRKGNSNGWDKPMQVSRSKVGSGDSRVKVPAYHES